MGLTSLRVESHPSHAPPFWRISKKDKHIMISLSSYVEEVLGQDTYEGKKDVSAPRIELGTFRSQQILQSNVINQLHQAE
jgi:hypothetical protein